MIKTDISLSKDHLHKVGDLYVVTSKIYGTFVMRCVANVDWYPHDAGCSIYEAMEWMDKYHPTKIASTCYIVDDPTARTSRYASVFFALASDNGKWYDTNKDCKYVKDTENRIKKFPIGLSDKELQKWIKNSVRFIIE